MSDLKERLAINIAGFANLIGKGQKGTLVVGDGDQTTYLTTEGAATGDVLTVDPTAPEGLSWATGGGGGSLLFQDGVTKSGSTVRNDLVTGTPVAAFRADVTPTGNFHATAGDALLFLDGTTSNARINTAGPEIRLDTSDGDIFLSAAGSSLRNGDVNIAADTATGTVDINGGSTILRGALSVTINPANNKPLTIATGGTGDAAFNFAHDENHTIGRNFSLSAAGASGVQIEASTDDADIRLIAGGAPGEAGLGAVKVTGADVILGPCMTFNGNNSFIKADGSVGDFIISGSSGSTTATIAITGSGGTIDINSGGALNLQGGTTATLSATTLVRVGLGLVGEKIKFYNSGLVGGASQHAAIADAAGGGTVDAQARTAINTLLGFMRDIGLIAT